MATIGKPDATGRSSGKFLRRDAKLHGPPEGEPWVWETTEMLASPAWRAISVNARRLIDYLKIEHRKHAARENGRLYATHEQLREYGMTGDCIRPAVEEAEFLGFIKAERGGRWNGTNTPSRYTLTFYATHDDQAATNDWRRVTEAQIAEYREEKRARRKGHKIRSATSRTRGTVLR